MSAMTACKSIQGSELEKALDNDKLRKMLNGTFGAQSLRFLFINENVNQTISDLVYLPETSSSLKGYDLRDVWNLAKSLIKKKALLQRDIVFISRNRQVNVRTRNGEVSGDYVFYSVIDELKRSYPELSYHLHSMDESHTRFEQLGSVDLLRALCQVAGKSIAWKLNRKDIIDELEAKGCGHIAACSDRFFQFRPLLRYALIGYDLRNMIDAADPKVVVSNDDCIYTKLIQRETDNKSIVLQSASMVECIEDCRRLVFKERDLLPDLYLAAGEAFGNLKKRYGIAKEVIVTGLPRYDILYDAQFIYSKSDFLKKHGLDQSQRIVLWSTQCHSLTDEENAVTCRAVFGAVSKLEGTTLVIKQHPAEGERYSEMLRDHMRESGINAVITPKDANTYELLSICDLMITKNSTTAREATALNKPVVILNLGGYPDVVDYVNEGVARGIYEECELKPAISELLEDDSDLARNRERYIKKYLYKIDGKATKRVIDLIKGQIDESALEKR